MRVEIYADFVCPWCFIGVRRLRRALAARPSIAVELAWRPFQLNPSMPKGGIDRATLLLSHTHWDHICGFPFFTPAYDPKWSMRILAGHLPHQGGIRSVLASQMTDPMFPVPLDAMR